MSQDRKQPNTNSNAATDKLKPNRTATKSDFRLMYKMTLENKKKKQLHRLISIFVFVAVSLVQFKYLQL